MGVGFGFNSLADAKLGLKNARAWGYGSDRFRKWYERRVTSNDEYRFGYLPPRMAKPYLEDAYGDYAERLRRGKP